MPERVDTTPPQIKPFQSHGLELTWPIGDNQAVGDCPFCDKESKFYVDLEKGLWNCLVCGENGNVRHFLTKLWEKAMAETTHEQYAALAKDRGLLYPETPMEWGACVSPLTGEWLIPGYGTGGKLDQLYRWIEFTGTTDGKRRRVLVATFGLGHALMGMLLRDPSKQQVHLCEGPWDGMAWWEALKITKRTDLGKLMVTGNEQASLLAEINVLAAPGANAFDKYWPGLFVGKDAVMLYDNDHPRKQMSGKTIDGAGLGGMKRIADILASFAPPPKSIRYLAWGTEGWNPKLPDGFDLRDVMVRSGVGPERAPAALSQVFANVAPVPPDWIPGRSAAAVKGASPELEPLSCDNWGTLLLAWKNAMEWHDGLERALSVMLAAVISTDIQGDQLWVKVMGPAGSGKTTLCEAVGLSKRYAYQTSIFTGFHSGYKTDQAGDEDHGLIPKVNGKTFIIKDADTLLRAPNLHQILAEMRDIYDGASRSHYKHGVSRVYNNICMTFILCGTSGLRELDSSELGARYLDCVMMNEIDEEFEDRVQEQSVFSTWHDMDNVDTDDDSSVTKHVKGTRELKTLARRLTGGYVEHLRDNARHLVGRVKALDKQIRYMKLLGRFVSKMRARPSKRQEEQAEREFSTRLSNQLTRMMRCLAAVLGKEQVDGDVIRRVRRVAFDTASGRTMRIAKALMEMTDLPNEGMDLSLLAREAHEDDERIKPYVAHLRRIGVLEKFMWRPAVGMPGKPKWRLTPSLKKLYEKVMGA